MSERPRAVVLLSGGMDSVVALYDARENCDVVACVSCNYGSKHNLRELRFAAEHAESCGVPHFVVPLAFVAEHFASDLLASGGEIPRGHYEEESMKKTVVPFRNGIMLAIAAGFAESRGADALIIAAHAGDHAIYPDCREDFMRAMSDAVRLGTYAAIEIVRPFISMTKADIARRGHILSVDFARTWSCYVGGEMHCGECGTCVERREAFALADLPDPTRYASEPPLPAKAVLISEIFYSIQGEGELTGVPSVIVRTSGCNLRCTWCDTKYASWNPEGDELSIDEIVARVASFPARHVVLTGGEPMIAKGMRELAQRLHELGLHLTIETAGTVTPAGIACDLASLSPKLSNSTPDALGEGWRERHEHARLQPAILREWIERFPFQLKFVVETAQDVVEIESLVREIGVDIPPSKILLMPQGTDLGTIQGREETLIELCKSRGYRYCHRLHIALFGHTKGT